MLSNKTNRHLWKAAFVRARVCVVGRGGGGEGLREEGLRPFV